MSEPREKSSSIGVVFLLLVLGFALCIWLDAFGVGTMMGKLINIPVTRDKGASNATPTAPPSPTAPMIATPPVTQAWFLDAAGYEGAEAERKSSGAPMLVYFHRRGCEPCKRIEHELLAAPEVKQAMASDVRVRIDLGAGDREARLAQRFGVGAELPMLIAIAPDGRQRTIALRSSGALLTPAQFVAALR